MLILAVLCGIVFICFVWLGCCSIGGVSVYCAFGLRFAYVVLRIVLVRLLFGLGLVFRLL